MVQISLIPSLGIYFAIIVCQLSSQFFNFWDLVASRKSDHLNSRSMIYGKINKPSRVKSPPI